MPYVRRYGIDYKNNKYKVKKITKSNKTDNNKKGKQYVLGKWIYIA